MIEIWLLRKITGFSILTRVRYRWRFDGQFFAFSVLECMPGLFRASGLMEEDQRIKGPRLKRDWSESSQYAVDALDTLNQVEKMITLQKCLTALIPPGFGSSPCLWMSLRRQYYCPLLECQPSPWVWQPVLRCLNPAAIEVYHWLFFLFCFLFSLHACLQ